MTDEKHPSEYNHQNHAGNFADVMKHVVLQSVILEQQKIHPEGLIIADTHCGSGVYDLSRQNPAEWKMGVGKLLKRYTTEERINEMPPPIRNYMKNMTGIVGCADFDEFKLYPGSPLIVQSLLRANDELRLTDTYVEFVEGLGPATQFAQLDAYEPEALSFIMPKGTKKHPLIFIDGAYTTLEEFGKTKRLLEDILERNPFATVVIWIPFIQDHKFRWSFATGLRNIAKEKAKVGRYYGNIVVCKTGLQGSATLVVNPTPLFDDVVDPRALHWMAHVMNNGKDEYTVEQIMRKKKKGPLED